jgi:predicted nucleic acid-binding protein
VVSALLDTGPVVALINRADAHHLRAAEFFKRFRGRLWSTEAVLTEVAYVLAPSLAHQTAALTWLQRSINAGVLRFESLSGLAQVATLLTKYADLPADFADVSLVWLAQQKRINNVVTVDERDFTVYRSYAGKPFKNLFR